MSEAPSAVPWAGGITVFHQGLDKDKHVPPPGPNGQLWYTYSRDGTNWGPDTQVPNVAISKSPSAVLWAGGITVFHQGSHENGQVWYTYFNGTNWGGETHVPNVAISESPSAVVWAGGITVFHQGCHENEQCC